MSTPTFSKLATTGIGSLPTMDTAAAVAEVFSLDIPYLPTFPGAGEAMLEAWQAGASVRAWAPFLEACRRKKPPWVKVQLVGPVTLAQVLPSESSWRQAVEGLKEKSKFLIGELQGGGSSVLFFWDEPSLGFWDGGRALDLKAWEALGQLILYTKGKGALAGVHCCGEFEPGKILKLPLDILSFDASLCLDSLLESSGLLMEWFSKGGRLALGAVPTRVSDHWQTPELAKKFQNYLGEEGLNYLNKSLLTPACGLGTRTVEESIRVFQELKKLKRILI